MKKKKKTVLIIIGIIVILIAAPILYFLTMGNLIITLNGDNNITLNYNEEYIENGAKAKYLFKEIDNINIEGTVDTSKIGTYEITYKVKYANSEATSKRTINIVDKKDPSIELEGNENIKLYVGNTYNEPGYKASDEYDGDLTDKVIVENQIDINKSGKYKITYTVEDSSNNKTTTTRSIEVLDKPKTTNTGGVPVLMYHFFYDKNNDSKNDGNWMEIHLFEEQMKYLSDNEYYQPTWDELRDYVDGKTTLPQKSVIVTADDGNPSFFELAIPICQKYNIRCTSFIVSSWTHGDWIASTFKNKGIDFQSHTYDMHKGGCKENHGGLMNCIPYESGVNDIKKSMEDLNQVNKVQVLAYPFGDFNDNVRKITQDAGIELAFTTEYGKVQKGQDKLKLPRIRINDGTSVNAFAAKL